MRIAVLAVEVLVLRAGSVWKRPKRANPCESTALSSLAQASASRGLRARRSSPVRVCPDGDRELPLQEAFVDVAPRWLAGIGVGTQPGPWAGPLAGPLVGPVAVVSGRLRAGFGRGEVVALPVVDADPTEDLGLLLALDALRQDLRPDAVAEAGSRRSGAR